MTSLPNFNTKLDARSLALRRKIVETLNRARRGHVGATFSLVEMLRVLYDDILRYDATRPDWAGRDRFILSKGHGCIALYVMLAEKGFFPEEELWKFCKSDGILGGHPQHGKAPGVEASTGSLGHGLPIGLGMALHLKVEKSDSRVFVILGDGECDEGSVWEAALCAGKHKLRHLTAIVDYNKMQSYATVAEVQCLEPFADKWRAFGWAVEEVDGHDVMALQKLFRRLPLDQNKPTAIISHTIKGKGVPFVEGNLKWHHMSKITDEDIQSLNAALQE